VRDRADAARRGQDADPHHPQASRGDGGHGPGHGAARRPQRRGARDQADDTGSDRTRDGRTRDEAAQSADNAAPHGGHPRRARGVAYVPEDRRIEGLVLAFTVADDFILGKQDRPPYAMNGVLDPAAILKAGGRLAVEYDVRPPNPRAIVANLSGGNQQKVVLGRELSERPKLIVVSQPTRGLDIAATEYVHE